MRLWGNQAQINLVFDLEELIALKYIYIIYILYIYEQIPWKGKGKDL